MPQGWSLKITPEGDVYFWNSGLRIVTPTDVTIPDFHAQLIQGYETLKTLLDTDGSTLLDYELYLNLSSKGTMDYYFVDRTGRQLFWLEPAFTCNLKLPPLEMSNILSSSFYTPATGLSHC